MLPNPYSTHRARQSWQNGFDGLPLTLLDWPDCWARGKTCMWVPPDRFAGWYSD